MFKIDYSELKKIFVSSKNNLIKILCLLKYKILLYILTFILTIMGASIINIDSYSNNLESFADKIAETIDCSNYEKQHLEIMQKNNGVNIESKLIKYMSEYNPLSGSGNKYFDCAIGVNSIVNPMRSFIAVNGKQNITKSFILPKTNSIIKYRDTFIMETYDLEMYFENDDIFPNPCYISDEYAKELLINENKSSFDELIGVPVNVSYYKNGVNLNKLLYIENIYYSEKKSAPYLLSVLGDFIIPGMSYFDKIDDSSLMIDFKKSSYRNIDAINILIKSFNLEEFKWIFLNEKYEDKIDTELFNTMIDLLFISDKNLYFIIGAIVLIVFFVFSFILLHRCNQIIINNDEKIYSSYYKFMLLITLFIMIIVHFIFKISNLNIMINSLSVMMWLFMFMVFTSILMIPIIVRKKKRGENDEIN